MLNEKRVKHMVKLASYESKYGEEEFKASSYFKKDYISFNVLCSLLWVTAGYLILAGLLGIAYMDDILENLTLMGALMLVTGIIGVYVIVLILYAVFAARYYKKKHAAARQDVKNFAHELQILEKMYETEES